MGGHGIYDDGTYLRNNPTWHEEDSIIKAGWIAGILKKNKINPSTVCEIGCGAGEILLCLADILGPGIRFSGYEISPQAFEICRKKEKENIRFFLGDPLEADDARFDLAMAVDIFEHVEDYFGFLRKFRSMGKHKIFHIPLDISVQTVLRSSPILRERTSVGHIHYFTKETAVETLKDTGYEILDFRYTPSYIAMPNLGWKSLLLKLPRKFLFTVHQDMAVRILGGYSLLVLAA